MAVARDRAGESHKVVSVIGDGAMTAGEAFEGLANAGTIGTDLLVILNDNKMSISPNVGALSAYFSRLITHGLYNKARHDIRDLMERALGKHVTSAAQKLEHSVKGFLTPGTMFEQLGFRYVGPVDGHDIPTLVECLANLRDFRGPVFFHVVTQKGKGYPYAEEDPLKYHGVKAFDIQTGRFRPAAPTDAPVPSFTDAFADGMLEAMRADERVVGITAAMPTGTGLSKVENAFPDRVFDVGICEQHAVTFAAGLAADGQRPVAAIYSTFLQRGYDQLLHDVCLQNLPVVFAIDRAGPVGEDSPTQQGAFDLSFLRCVPNLTILAPRDALDLKQMLHWALKQDGPVAIRYARSAAPTLGEAKERDVTRATLLREGTDGAFFALGPAVAPSLEAAALLAEEGLEVAVADARLVKPLDTDMLRRLARRPMVTVEENSVVGGLGTAVMEWAEDEGLLGELRLARAGFPDRFLDHAPRAEQLEEIGLEAHRLAEKMRALLHRHADADTTV
jgi:1-deoxy-D-xylulose-5-phosphate synthase